MTRARQPPQLPLGPGVVARRLRIAADDVVRLGTLLAGYDGLVSVHGDAGEIITLITTPSCVAELDAVLAGLRETIAFDVLPDA